MCIGTGNSNYSSKYSKFNFKFENNIFSPSSRPKMIKFLIWKHSFWKWNSVNKWWWCARATPPIHCIVVFDIELCYFSFLRPFHATVFDGIRIEFEYQIGGWMGSPPGQPFYSISLWLFLIGFFLGKFFFSLLNNSVFMYTHMRTFFCRQSTE